MRAPTDALIPDFETSDPPRLFLPQIGLIGSGPDQTVSPPPVAGAGPIETRLQPSCLKLRASVTRISRFAADVDVAR